MTALSCVHFQFSAKLFYLPVYLEEEGHPTSPHRQKPRPGIEINVSQDGWLKSNLVPGKSHSEGIKQALFLFLAELKGHNLKAGRG